MREPKDPVVIRVWKTDPDDIFALFPTHPADNFGHFCSCYQHVGQHGSANYYGCITKSRPATRREATPLLRELRRIGYRLRVIKRASLQMHQQRHKASKEVKP